MHTQLLSPLPVARLTGSVVLRAQQYLALNTCPLLQRLFAPPSFWLMCIGQIYFFTNTVKPAIHSVTGAAFGCVHEGAMGGKSCIICSRSSCLQCSGLLIAFMYMRQICSSVVP